VQGRRSGPAGTPLRRPPPPRGAPTAVASPMSSYDCQLTFSASFVGQLSSGWPLAPLRRRRTADCTMWAPSSESRRAGARRPRGRDDGHVPCVLQDCAGGAGSAGVPCVVLRAEGPLHWHLRHHDVPYPVPQQHLRQAPVLLRLVQLVHPLRVRQPCTQPNAPQRGARHAQGTTQPLSS